MASGLSSRGKRGIRISRRGEDAPSDASFPAGPRERAVLDRAVGRAAEGLAVWIADGIERAAALALRLKAADLDLIFCPLSLVVADGSIA